jgi:hypothetical protein
VPSERLFSPVSLKKIALPASWFLHAAPSPADISTVYVLFLYRLVLGGVDQVVLVKMEQRHTPISTDIGDQKILSRTGDVRGVSSKVGLFGNIYLMGDPQGELGHLKKVQKNIKKAFSTSCSPVLTHLTTYPGR